MSWGIHWFRRDLRIAGNKALRENWKKTDGRVLGLFCFDSTFLARPDFSHNRFAFFLKTLKSVKQEFNAMGGDFIVVDKLPYNFLVSLLKAQTMSGKPLPRFISWNRDYEPYARKRDEQVEILLADFGVEAITARDHLVFEPDEIIKGNKPGSYYQVYSPFSRKWYDLLNSPEGAARIAKEKLPRDSIPSDVFKGTWKQVLPPKFEAIDQIDEFEIKNQRSVTIPIPEAGSHQALKVLKDFSDKIEDYKEQRDFPDIQGTSRLSMYLKNGSLTSGQIIKHLNLLNIPWHKPSGANQFLKEIVWREFYYHILFHRPDVENNSFIPDYQNIKWENRSDFFERWKDGTTGFPIVDAGMRELRETGWMHNRVRMIVASFLVKDLLIDWRWGEQHFMQYLLDGDLAPNNGGWQWAASTGCDPQPYFRIFNPWLQSKKFDPEGDYIKKYVPELRNASAKDIYEPYADRSRWKYPEPIVDHSTQRGKALRLYKSPN